MDKSLICNNQVMELNKQDCRLKTKHDAVLKANWSTLRFKVELEAQSRRCWQASAGGAYASYDYDT
jgi:hypothetical protein